MPRMQRRQRTNTTTEEEWVSRSPRSTGRDLGRRATYAESEYAPVVRVVLDNSAEPELPLVASPIHDTLSSELAPSDEEETYEEANEPLYDLSTGAEGAFEQLDPNPRAYLSTVEEQGALRRSQRLRNQGRSLLATPAYQIPNQGHYPGTQSAQTPRFENRTRGRPAPPPAAAPVHINPSVMNGVRGVRFTGGRIGTGAFSAVAGNQTFMRAGYEIPAALAQTPAYPPGARVTPTVLDQAEDVEFLDAELESGALSAVAGHSYIVGD